ncbi:MAG: DUF1553 domain-containing protein, partial [Planctomycetota bacterium]
DRYRRGLYTFFQRTSPHPMLALFDAPESTFSCVRRERSNTPLQALTLWNDPIFFESAAAFARRIIREARKDDTFMAALRIAFGHALSRAPSEREHYILEQLYRETKKAYAEEPALLEKVVKSAGKPPADVPTADWAAWVSIARALINLDEMITRN